jgi:hypothetical protein
LNRLTFLLLTTFLSGCSITDYQTKLQKEANCVSEYSAANFQPLVLNKEIKGEIGGKNSQCINLSEGKLYFGAYEATSKENFISVISHPNLGPSKSSFFLPKLIFLDENNTQKEVKILYVIKGSQIMHGSMYQYFYDVSNVPSRKFIVTTDIHHLGKQFDYEHLNSYDNQTIHYSKMPYAAGSKVDVILLNKI